MVDFKINDITIKRIDKNIKTNIYPLFNLLDSICFKIFDFPLAVKNRNQIQAFFQIQLSSIKFTLITISFCLSNNYYSDAFTLARKLRDDLFQFLFINKKIKEFTDNLFNENEDTIAIVKWINCQELDKKEKGKFEYRYYKSVIIDSCKEIQEIANIIFENKLSFLNVKLNDYVRGNSILHLLNNDLRLYKNQTKICNEIFDILKKLIDFFFCSLIIIFPYFMQSDDYVKSEISPYFQEYIDNNLSCYKDLKIFLKNNCIMKIE